MPDSAPSTPTLVGRSEELAPSTGCWPTRRQAASRTEAVAIAQQRGLLGTGVP